MKVTVVPNKDGLPYLIRFFLLELFGWALKLHIFLRSDDRHLHDHPWTFWSLILAGGYYEWSEIDPRYAAFFPPGSIEQVAEKWYARRWHGPGSLRRCKSPYPHRVELKQRDDAEDITSITRNRLQPAVTLLLMAPRTREWGFYCNDGRWIPWKIFDKNPSSCEETP